MNTYVIVRIIVFTICIVASALFWKKKKEYNSPENASAKEEIIKYFEEQGAFSADTAIKIKDLPDNIKKSPNLNFMYQDGTLSLKKGKYFLNR